MKRGQRPNDDVPESLKHFSWYADTANRIVQSLRNASVPVANGNRFEIYAKALKQYSQSPGNQVTLSGDQKAIVFNALIEIEQAARITTYLACDDGWTHKLRHLASGHPLSHKDCNNLARSTQAELFTAASFRRAGIQVHPPAQENAAIDFEITVRKWRLGVEAKRITSIDQAVAHARYASGQLRRAGRVGLVAFDISQVVSARGSYTRVNDAYAASKLYWEQMTSFIVAKRDELRRRVDPTYVCAFMLVMTHSVFDASKNTLGAMSGITTYWPWSDSDLRVESIRYLQHQIAKADQSFEI